MLLMLPVAVVPVGVAAAAAAVAACIQALCSGVKKGGGVGPPPTRYTGRKG